VVHEIGQETAVVAQTQQGRVLQGCAQAADRVTAIAAMRDQLATMAS
jgi:hypothetical protein